jgi:hypothetical protein
MASKDNKVKKKNELTRRRRNTTTRPKKRAEEVDQDTERALFLKPFAEDTTKSYKYYAREFNIPEEEAYDYVKKFIWLMIHTWNEDDGPDKVAAVLNDGVNNRMDQITVPEVQALKPLVKKYGRYEIVDKLQKEKKHNQGFKNNESVSAQKRAF